MSRKHEKRYKDWKDNTPTLVRKEDVGSLLEEYFGNSFTQAQGGSHQYRINHEALKEHPHMEGGMLSIPVSGGQSVKKIYIKRIITAIDLLLEWEKTKENDGDENE